MKTISGIATPLALTFVKSADGSYMHVSSHQPEKFFAEYAHELDALNPGWETLSAAGQLWAQTEWTATLHFVGAAPYAGHYGVAHGDVGVSLKATSVVEGDCFVL